MGRWPPSSSPRRTSPASTARSMADDVRERTDDQLADAAAPSPGPGPPRARRPVVAGRPGRHPGQCPAGRRLARPGPPAGPRGGPGDDGAARGRGRRSAARGRRARRRTPARRPVEPRPAVAQSRGPAGRPHRLRGPAPPGRPRPPGGRQLRRGACRGVRRDAARRGAASRPRHPRPTDLGPAPGRPASRHARPGGDRGAVAARTAPRLRARGRPARAAARGRPGPAPRSQPRHPSPAPARPRRGARARTPRSTPPRVSRSPTCSPWSTSSPPSGDCARRGCCAPAASRSAT